MKNSPDNKTIATCVNYQVFEETGLLVDDGESLDNQY